MIVDMYSVDACCDIMPNSYSPCMLKAGAVVILIIICHIICGCVLSIWEFQLVQDESQQKISDEGGSVCSNIEKS